MEDQIQQLVEAEWAFFQSTVNEGGRASCQDDYETFRIMRSSQAECWSSDLLDGWLQDLAAMKEAGRNPMIEKYGRMMETTDPEAYVNIEASLPEVAPEVKQAAAQVALQMAEWAGDAADLYPLLVSNGRVFYTEDDAYGVTSIETYARCELESFSLKTIEAYQALCKRIAHEGGNLYLDVQQRMAAKQGYGSLNEVEYILATTRKCCYYDEQLSLED